MYWQIALDYVKKYGVNIMRVLTLEKNRGKGGAVRMVRCWWLVTGLLAYIAVVHSIHSGSTTVCSIFTARLRSIRTVLLSRFRLSVYLSNACIVTKLKHLVKKSSIMTNRKSSTSFPMSLRWTSYVTPKPPKGASKAQIWPIICNNFETVRDRM